MFMSWLMDVLCHLLASLCVKILERFATSEYAKNVADGITARAQEFGRLAGASSALRAVFRIADPSPYMTAALFSFATMMIVQACVDRIFIQIHLGSSWLTIVVETLIFPFSVPIVSRLGFRLCEAEIRWPGRLALVGIPTVEAWWLWSLTGNIKLVPLMWFPMTLIVVTTTLGMLLFYWVTRWYRGAWPGYGKSIDLANKIADRLLKI